MGSPTATIDLLFVRTPSCKGTDAKYSLRVTGIRHEGCPFESDPPLSPPHPQGASNDMNSAAALLKYAGIASVLVLGFIIVGVRIMFPRVDLHFGSINSVPSLNSNSNSQASPVWEIGDFGKVQMLFENTKRYQVDTDEGVKEWESLVPKDGGIIYQRNAETGELEEFTISMFHQLRCLNVLRLELIRPTRFHVRPPNEPVVKHCLNYIRQMILCRSDLYLESVRDPIGPHAVDVTHVKTCKDWRKVYSAAENQQGLGLF